LTEAPDGDRPLGLDPEDFLQRYWQRQHLLVRGAAGNFTPPVSADELAGLALEDEVESRIVEHAGDEWRLHHGPFAVEDFQRGNPWTLLVQSVDHHLPQVAALRRLVNFIPQWRIDDVMVSYAVDGGSVGPHYDNYDVFLLQGEGRRRWRVGQPCGTGSALLPHDELRILREFDCRDEYVLECGDMLYLPPGVAHWGIAEGECTTFSIGFRAPRINDLVSRYVDARLELIDPELFYSDAGMAPSLRAGEIRPGDLALARRQVEAALLADPGGRWLGELVTEPRPDRLPTADTGSPPWDSVATAELEDGARLAWLLHGTRVTVFANGDSRDFPDSLAPAIEGLCAGCVWNRARLDQLLEDPQGEDLLDYLVETGCLYVQ